MLRCYSDYVVPENLSVRALGEKHIVFLLSVKEAKEEWLMIVQDDLNTCLNATMRIWKVQKIKVINEEGARRKNYTVK